MGATKKRESMKIVLQKLREHRLLYLIPDFIPVLGQIDDLIIVPAGMAVAVKMIPKCVLDECRQKARNQVTDSRTKYLVAGIIVGIYALAFYIMIKLIIGFV